MKRKSLLFMAAGFLSLASIGQTVVNDSAVTGSGNTNMVFYNLQTGVKTVVSNTDWHVAVSVRSSVFPNNTLQGTTVRINEAFGVKVYLIPGFTADSFNVSVDTTGFHNWQKLNDSDSLLDLGALNTGLNIGAFNYGWGVYGGSPNHDVEGKKVYLFELPNGAVKKFLVQELDRDTAWNLKYADIDNSNLQTLRISKRDYIGKNLVYISLTDHTVRDKEPLSSSWQLQFLKYAATDVQTGKTLPAVGVLTNKGITVARRDGMEVSDNSYSGLLFKPDMNAIGWNWKYLINNQLLVSGKDEVTGRGTYRVHDSLAYFIQTPTDVYKIVFTGYTGSSAGIIQFYKQALTNTRIAETEPQQTARIYPNPADDFLTIESDILSSYVNVLDMNGKAIFGTPVSGDVFRLNTSGLPNGVYLLSVSSPEKSNLIRKFIVNHF